MKKDGGKRAGPTGWGRVIGIGRVIWEKDVIKESLWLRKIVRFCLNRKLSKRGGGYRT